jgi:sugar phosphate isomerase/epimerase
MADLSRLCIHTITTRPWSIELAVPYFADAGVRGISVWRDALEGRDADTVRHLIERAGLSVTSLVRGGFFTAGSAADRLQAIEDNRRALEECEAVGAPLLVLVCGATPGQSVADNVDQIQEGIEAILEQAESTGIRLAVEPLHPMYADTRSAIATVKMANDLCDRIDSSMVGVTVDVFHCWWDPDLQAEITRAGDAGRLFSYHVCDWKTEMSDMLNDRGLMGEGVIDIPRITSWMDDAGFDGAIEVEIFSTRWWAEDQGSFLSEIIDTYTRCV